MPEDSIIADGCLINIQRARSMVHTLLANLTPNIFWHTVSKITYLTAIERDRMRTPNLIFTKFGLFTQNMNNPNIFNPSPPPPHSINLSFNFTS